VAQTYIHAETLSNNILKRQAPRLSSNCKETTPYGVHVYY